MNFNNHNPWGVTSIDSFNFLCCPECSFRSKEESNFQSHALQNHPKSKIFFKPGEILTKEETVENFTKGGGGSDSQFFSKKQEENMA